MPQPKKGPRLGSNPSHQRLMLRNLARSLFEHERIQTTEAKAKMLRPFAEKLITKAKKGDLHNRRLVLSEIENREVVHKLFDDIGPRFAARNGGYTRILKLGQRSGDAAPMALIELIEDASVATADGETTTSRRRRGLRRSRQQVEERRAERAAAAEAAMAAEEAEFGEQAPEDVDDEGASPGDADSDQSQGTPGDAQEPEAEADEDALAEAEENVKPPGEGPTGAGGAPGKQ